MPPTHSLPFRIARTFMAALWLGGSLLVFAQEPQTSEEPTIAAAKKEAANENTEEATAQDAQTEKPAPQPLGPPTQFIYNEVKRSPLLSNELKFIRGNAKPIELTGELETVTAVWQEDLSGNPVGAALILTPASLSPSSIEIQNLQYYLALNGWSSLTITTLPEDSTAPPPVSAIVTPPPNTLGNEAKTTPVEDAKPESANAESDTEIDESEVVYQEPEDAAENQQERAKIPAASSPNSSDDSPPSEPLISNREKMIERIELGFKALEDKNYFNNVLIAYESSAGNFANFLSSSERSEAANTSLQAIVFVNVKAWDQDVGILIDPAIKLQLPTLDIINKTYPISIKAQTERRNRATQLKHSLYSARQLRLGEINTEQENALSRAIRGFITRHASGTETDQ